MSEIRGWDEYEIKARYIPTFLTAIPISQFLILLLGVAFWREIASNVSWMVVVSNLSLSLIMMIAIVQIQSSIAKYWVEESIFGKGGERFPTTEMVLYNDGGLISIQRKEQIRNKIIQSFGCTLSTESDEKNDAIQARLLARESVGYVRRAVGRGVMTFQYNIRYGFFRNLIGGSIWSFTGSIGCSIFYGINNNYRAMGIFILLTLIYSILFLLRNALLTNLAYTYADTLFNEFLYMDEINKRS